MWLGRREGLHDEEVQEEEEHEGGEAGRGKSSFSSAEEFNLHDQSVRRLVMESNRLAVDGREGADVW